MTLDDLRRYAVARSLFSPTTLKRALDRLVFVQADPIRAPARAQDLTLRHRVRDYRAGDLERRYVRLGVEEDFFVNYGFLTREVHSLMHPRGGRLPWSAESTARVDAMLDYVRARGEAHPRAVDDHFAHGTVTNYWGGSSSATTHLLELMHYRGLLRVARREGGIRIYAVREQTRPAVEATAREGSIEATIDALVDAAVRTYAPVPSPTLTWLVARLQYGVPQWKPELRGALQRARTRLSRARVAEVDWYWPAGERPKAAKTADTVRLLAPFDPIVWDRRRFEHFWGWAYRFEAYTPAAKRKLGYYALPLLWGDRMPGWANLSVREGELRAEIGYVTKPPKDRRFARALEAELERMRVFLGHRPTQATDNTD